MIARSGCLKSIAALAGLTLLAGILYPLVIQPWHLSWGASSAEQQTGLPGDEFIPNPLRVNTRAITIRASADQAWPWVAQMGADKGGLYSYAWLEALINCPIRNADRIHSEWQDPQPGDSFPLCPGEFGPPPYEVVAVVPGEALIVGHRFRDATEQVAGTDWYDTWAFVLQPAGDNATRMLVRSRYSNPASWVRAIEPGVFLMERGLMLGLRARVEGSPLDPSIEALYRLVFAALLAGYLWVRYGLDLGKRRDRQEKAAQSRIEQVITWLVWLLLLPALFYPFTSWLDLFHLSLPGWLRGLGGILFLAGDLLFFWTRRALGENWSPVKGVDQSLHLVTRGPYRFIRHPMYAAMFLVTGGMFLLAANLLVGIPYLLAVTAMYLKWVGSEETSLLAEYGAEYREYSRQTGRLLPRLGR